MIRKESGFSLVELMIVMLMSGLILAAASSAFIGLLNVSRTQGGIAESNENLIGLDILRRDIEIAGYGLFWDWGDAAPIAYPESAGNPYGLNDTSNAPRAIISKHAAVYAAPDNVFNGSDYLVIKSMNVSGGDRADNVADQKWTYVSSTNLIQVWAAANSAAENLQPNERVITLSVRNQTTRPLIVAGNFFTTINGTGTGLNDSNFAPTDANDTYAVYGINSTKNPLASPFNRADYFISRNVGDGVPARCAPNTGILYKAIMNQDQAADGPFTYLPLLDCVANMQVVFGVDVDQDGLFQPSPGGDTYTSDLATLATPLTTAAQIRSQVKEVRVYILTHEGRKDMSYTSTANINVGETLNYGVGAFAYPLTPDQLHYRWKVYQLVAKPLNLLN